ncbi:3-isopropylmalate dehydratase small subunit [Novosphingobium sp. CECT 9465]|uniref:3-isopropylmalate dehydratase small subunit n=1 Tax=Novosphingobium sp. CECT 9465 TaxID=2829794 RepID=UPI001E4FF86C|nr:3-isopropylmalate dehydratase small subunit [Novosphingobium sp. CECT 9465]CAH0495281.1 3-isopropylmalate dehydratase small subunit 1 [Novosphingobium sp. CECT 9465]
MDTFDRLHGIAAPLDQDDIDTDIIYPARFLLITERAGLGQYAFFDWRFDTQGQPRPDFVLNQPPWSDAQIIVAGQNFGCGSSREQALWTMAGIGIRCVIAPSFGDIFHANCFKNAILPITLPAADHAAVVQQAQAARAMTVDLQTCTITLGDGTVIGFALDERRRQSLLNGWDELDTIRLTHAADIERFENMQRAAQPWLWRKPERTN